MNDSSHEEELLGNTVSLWSAAGKYSQAPIEVFFWGYALFTKIISFGTGDITNETQIFVFQYLLEF